MAFFFLSQKYSAAVAGLTTKIINLKEHKIYYTLQCRQVKFTQVKSSNFCPSQVASHKNWRLESESSPSHRLESTTLTFSHRVWTFALFVWPILATILCVLYHFKKLTSDQRLGGGGGGGFHMISVTDFVHDHNAPPVSLIITDWYREFASASMIKVKQWKRTQYMSHSETFLISVRAPFWPVTSYAISLLVLCRIGVIVIDLMHWCHHMILLEHTIRTYSKAYHTLLKKIKGTWSAPSLVCGHSQVQLLEDMHNCTSLKSLMFKKQLTLLAMSLTQPWHLFKG